MQYISKLEQLEAEVGNDSIAPSAKRQRIDPVQSSPLYHTPSPPIPSIPLSLTPHATHSPDWDLSNYYDESDN
jgi:hypothetical protein